MRENKSCLETAPNPASRPALPILTSLRFFASSEVVIYHYADKDFLFPIYADYLRGWASAGYEAVTFFFVLSGFILTYVYSGSTLNCPLTINPRDFIKARTARISPAYFLALSIALPAFAYSAFFARIIRIDVFIVSLFLVPAFLQSWYPPTAFAWNGPAWSLSVEMLFYSSFHSLTNLARRFSLKNFLILSYLIVVFVAVARQFWLPRTASIESGSWYFNFIEYFPLLHLPQFLFGVALGRLYVFGKFLSPQAHLWLMITGFVPLALVFAIGGELPWIKTDAILVILFGLIILGGAKSPAIVKQILASTFLIVLGEASYGIYILQAPIAFWWNQLTRKILNLTLAPSYDFGGYFLVLCALSVLSYLYFETPLRRKLLGHREHVPA